MKVLISAFFLAVVFGSGVGIGWLVGHNVGRTTSTSASARVVATATPAPEGDDATCPGVLTNPTPLRVYEVTNCLSWFYQAPVSMRPFTEPPQALWADACARHYARQVEDSIQGYKSPC